jgi:hypothetical protein
MMAEKRIGIYGVQGVEGSNPFTPTSFLLTS